MGKKVSPVEKFPGFVVLPDFLTLPQVIAFEDAIGQAEELKKGGTVRRSRLDQINLPVIFAIVKEWHVDGVPETPDIESMPLTPRVASATLIAWIWGEITRLYIGEKTVPNE